MVFTIEVALHFIAALINFTNFLLIFIQIRLGNKYRFYYFAEVAWMGVFSFQLLSGIAIYFLSIDIYRLGLLLLGIGDFFYLCLVDSLKRDSVEPIKLALLTVVTVAGIIFLVMFPDAVYQAYTINGDLTIKFNLSLAFTFGTSFFIPSVYYVVYVRELYIKAPKKIKSFALIYLIGTISELIALMFVFLEVLSLIPRIPGIVPIFTGFGALLMGIAYGKEPKLLFILPFKALRLSVIDTQSGISLFSHTWNAGTNIADDVLFSGMIQGINAIMKESVKRGAVQEIRLADAIMLTSYDIRYPVASILIATNPSKSLRDSLTLFAQKFNDNFHTCYNNCSDISQFKNAAQLITLCFPFVPEYD